MQQIHLVPTHATTYGYLPSNRTPFPVAIRDEWYSYVRDTLSTEWNVDMQQLVPVSVCEIKVVIGYECLSEKPGI